MFEGLFQPMHLLVIFGIALLVFGPKKLPELGKGLGDGIRGFKSAMKETVEAADKARGSEAEPELNAWGFDAKTPRSAGSGRAAQRLSSAMVACVTSEQRRYWLPVLSDLRLFTLLYI